MNATTALVDQKVPFHIKTGEIDQKKPTKTMTHVGQGDKTVEKKERTGSFENLLFQCDAFRYAWIVPSQEK